MLTTGEAISAAGKYAVNQGADSVETDQKFRDRGLFFLNQIAKKTWMLAPLWYRLATSGTVTITSASGPMPADFSSMGVHGNVYDADGNPLDYLEPGAFYALRANSPTATSSKPEVWTLGSKTAVGLSTLQTHPPVPSTATLTARGYVKRMPDLIDRPNRVTTAAGAVGGNLNGAYTYKVTFVNPLGETEAGVVSASRSVSSARIELSAIPVSTNRSVTARKVYRTAASGTDWKLLTTLSDNSTTVYTDNTADGSLGASAPTVSTAVTGLEIFPEDLQETVLLEGLIAKFQESQGDLRAKKRMEGFEGEILRAWAEFKQGKNIDVMLPAFGAQSYSGSGRSFRDRLQGN